MVEINKKKQDFNIVLFIGAMTLVLIKGGVRLEMKTLKSKERERGVKCESRTKKTNRDKQDNYLDPLSYR